MNNEETIVMKPQNNNKAEQTQSVETVDKKSNKGKKVVATADRTCKEKYNGDNCGRCSRWWCCLCCYGNAP